MNDPECVRLLGFFYDRRPEKRETPAALGWRIAEVSPLRSRRVNLRRLIWRLIENPGAGKQNLSATRQPIKPRSLRRKRLRH